MQNEIFLWCTLSDSKVKHTNIQNCRITVFLHALVDPLSCIFESIEMFRLLCGKTLKQLLATHNYRESAFIINQLSLQVLSSIACHLLYMGC